MTTSTPRESAEFDRLVSAYFDQQISESEFSELQDRLRQHPSARRRYLHLAAVHGSLAWVCATQPQRQADIAAAARMVSQPEPKPQLVGTVGWRSALTAAAAVLAAAMLLPGFPLTSPTPNQPTPNQPTPNQPTPNQPTTTSPATSEHPMHPQSQPPRLASVQPVDPDRNTRVGEHTSADARRARLIEHTGVVQILSPTEPSLRATVGQELMLTHGQSVHTAGNNSYAVVALEDGTRLELSAATTVRLASSAVGSADANTSTSDPLFLSAGTVRVQSHQPNPGGLRLETPHAQLRVSASTFTCSVGETATRLEMDGDAVGQAQVVRRADGRAVQLRPGDYVVSGMEPTSELAPRPLVSTDVLIPRNTMRLSGPAVALSADGARLATVMKGQVTVWSTTTGLVEFTLDTGRDRVRQLHFAGDGRSLATLSTQPGEGESPVLHWDLLHHRLLRSLHEPASPWLQTLSLSPDGRTLVTTEPPHESNGRVGRLFWWSTATGESLHTLDLPRNQRVTSVAFSPDGRRLAAAVTDGSLTLYDARSTRVLARFRTANRRSDRADSLAFSAEGNLLAATCSNGAELRLWDLRDRPERADMISFSGQGRRFRCVAVSTVDGYLAAGSADGNLFLWDLRTGQEVLTSRLSNRSVPLVAFSPNGRTLTALSESGMVRQWQFTLPTGR